MDSLAPCDYLFLETCLEGCGSEWCMPYQVVLEAAGLSSGLKQLSEVLPDRWRNDFWGHQLPQNYHQLQLRNATSAQQLHASAAQVISASRTCVAALLCLNVKFVIMCAVSSL